MFFLTLFVALLALSALAQVDLDYGTFVGKPDANESYTSFLGIRFADPPVGELRWRAPVSPPSTSVGTVNASEFGSACIATKTAGDIPSSQSEDCLFVNVYVPSGVTPEQLVPVLVYFHGGGFEMGDPRGSQPTYLFESTAEPFVYVTIQYRLGQFGFLSGPEVGQDGDYNVGMLDQRAGLRWVQRYIAQFGGDAERVTIWGSSAGAGATMFHLIANGGDNEGLFHQAIGNSPSLNYMPSADSEYDQSVFHDFSAFAGCDGASDVLACLRNATSKSLANAGNSVTNARGATVFTFSPRLDGTFLTERPVEALNQGSFARVPVFYGSNTNEGAGWSSGLEENANTASDNATQTTVYNFLRGQYDSFTEESFEKALDFYPLSDYGTYDLQGQQMYGEARYICSALLITDKALENGQPTFQYHYNNERLGSNHGNEGGALFGSPDNANADDTAIFESMRQYWTSFVTSGEPVASDGAAWQASDTTGGGPRMLLDPSNSTMENMPDPLIARCEFWHSISEELQT